MKYSIVLILLGANFLFLSAQEKTRIYYADKELVPRERFVDFSQLKLEVEFEPKKKLVRGTATERFTVLRKQIDTLFLDGINMRFFEVKLDGLNLF